ncbi:MAG: sel1 repeat family protein [Neisseriaceae bacterium]|nr:sel1 repeat family protein [Neisseriaceae bacterium]
MKNLFALCLIALSLVACSNEKNNETATQQENKVVTQQTEVVKEETTTALTNAEQEELENLLREADEFVSFLSPNPDPAKYIQAIQNERLLSLLKRSCDMGNKQHCLTYAMLPSMPEFMEVSNKFMQGDKSQAPRMLAIVDKMCNDGSADMCLVAADEFYLNGFQDDNGNELIPKDEAKAISLFDKACYAEIDTKENACYALSKIYKNGEIVPQDLVKAEELLQRAEQLKSERIKRRDGIE